MNYIEQINGFWRKNEEHLFGTTEIALYFHLLDICNKCNWTNPFKRRNTKICADLGLAKETFNRTRNKLKQAGLINFISNGKGDSNIKYVIVPLGENAQMKFKNETSKSVENSKKSNKKFENESTNESSCEASSETSFGSHNINLKQKPKTETKTIKSVFTPPTLDEVILFFKEKNFSETHAKKAFEYYQVAGWKDSKGQQVKNWKQKMIAVWMKDDNNQKNYGNNNQGLRPQSAPVASSGYGKL